MVQGALKLVFGSKYERDIKKMKPIVERVRSHEEAIKKLDDSALFGKTSEFRERYGKGETLDSLLPEAFAVVRETSIRTLKLRHYDVQIMGGIVLHSGSIAEMKTGEGKTLTSTLAIYLNAVTGKGVHVVTVNDYLAKRDAQWMSPIYSSLGLTVGSIVSNMNHRERQSSYSKDITYGTNNEFGFDYLRDNMVEHRSQMVQRGHYFAIVDEVDSILIDEARTPLIISGPSEENTDIYLTVNKIIPRLEDKVDFEIDEKARNILMTEMGVSKAEKLLGLENLYDPKNVDKVHHIHQALKAHYLFARDKDYVVQNNEVIIVDEFTGRLMEGRRYSDGLHQALEAKERVAIKQENQTLATITFQNYFRMYEKLSGMTGTADTEAVEFKKIYNLDVKVLPTHNPMVRLDNADKVYRTEREKFNAIADHVKECYLKGQPVLLGTVSIENSEKLAKLLTQRGIPHAILNAKYHEKEAEIIKDAGQKHKVTIATNMAGRGTDIVLGEGVTDAGGLYVIGSERHESRRIDNQLRGRSGRQGDPGASTFYLSLEDDLMRIFGSDRIGPIMQRLGMQEGEAIEHRMVSKAIERAQKRVESHNFEIRKHLLEYDDVMNKQRVFIYGIRSRILTQETIHEMIQDFIRDIIPEKINLFIPGKNATNWDLEGLSLWFAEVFQKNLSISEDTLHSMNPQETMDFFVNHGMDAYKAKEASVPRGTFSILERMVLLQVLDQKWKDHLYEMDHLKEGIWTMGYAQKEPLVEYRIQSFSLFEEMVAIIKEETLEFIFRAQIRGELEEEIPEEFHIQGEAKHVQQESYGVRQIQPLTSPVTINNERFQKPGNPAGSSVAAQKTAGGGSARKSTRRKR